MAVSVVKLRMLYIMKILLEKTDEGHTMSAADIGCALKGYGMSADRKTIYSDIETLREFKLDILQALGTHGGYYICSRRFELPELKLLVDAVQSSKFITSKKSEELIRKLEHLTSEHEAKQLQRHVFIYDRSKAGNETIYYNVDKIHTAILENRQIVFQYAKWTVGRGLVPKKDGAVYKASPWALTWDDGNYYLIAYDEAADRIKHYRVDKMIWILLLSPRRPSPCTEAGMRRWSFCVKMRSQGSSWTGLGVRLCWCRWMGSILRCISWWRSAGNFLAG